MSNYPLKPVSLEENASQSWELFQFAFEKYLTATKQKAETSEIKAGLLYGHAGEELQKTIVSWAFDEDTINDYTRLKAAITAKLTPEVNPSYASLLFNLATRAVNETVDDYAQRLRELVVPCKYADTEEESMNVRMVKDRIIVSLGDPAWQFALVKQKKLTLKTLMDELKLNESSLKQVKHMQQVQQENPKIQHAVHGITSRKASKSGTKHWSRKEKHHHRNSSESSRASRSTSPRYRRNSPVMQPRRRSPSSSDGEESNPIQCTRCGTNHGNRRCPAKSRVCAACNKLNHFQSVCFTRRKRQQDRRTNYVDSFYVASLEGPMPAHGFWYEDVKIDGEVVTFKLDPGAAVNTIPEDLLKRLKLQNTIKDTESQLVSFGGYSWRPKGVSELTVIVRRKPHRLRFIVVDTSDVPLLGMDTCVHLGLVSRVKPQDDGAYVSAITVGEPTKRKNLSTENSVTQETQSATKPGQSENLSPEKLPQDKEQFVAANRDLFEGIGKMPGKIHIDIDETVRPRVCFPNRLPQSTNEKAKETLREMEKQDVIVPEPEPKSWVSRLLFREKPDGTLRPCVDPRLLNQAVDKNKNHSDLPVVSQLARP